jgi:hypothetical protein
LYCNGVSVSFSAASLGLVNVIRARKRRKVRLSTSGAVIFCKRTGTTQVSRVPPGVLATMADPLKSGDAKLWRLRRSYVNAMPVRPPNRSPEKRERQ